MSHREALLAVLAERGETPTTDRSGLCPLLEPLSKDAGGTTALLRWPTPPKDMPAPLVRQVGHGVRLLAASTEQFLRRVDVLREHAGHPPTGPVYVPGSLAASKLPVHAYLLLKVGGLPETYEALAVRHEEKGDLTAALVTLDRCAGLFPDWGRYHALRAELFQRQERLDEARDTARAALAQPLWTLGAPVADVAAMAKLEITSERVRGLEGPILDRAAHLLDAAFLEEDWDAVRAPLSAIYREAGLDEVADFVS